MFWQPLPSALRGKGSAIWQPAWRQPELRCHALTKISTPPLREPVEMQSPVYDTVYSYRGD
jgi:hypothetical protein